MKHKALKMQNNTLFMLINEIFFIKVVVCMSMKVCMNRLGEKNAIDRI